MSQEIDVYAEICRKNVKLPEYARLFDAGMDVCAACDIEIYPGETKLIPTGLKMAIPEGYEIQIRPRSGISANTPLRIPNSPGTLDAGYRDEIFVAMSNSSSLVSSSETTANMLPLNSKGNVNGIYKIKEGDRIAQFVLCKTPRIKFVLTDNISNIGTNRGGGFGSSGV